MIEVRYTREKMEQKIKAERVYFEEGFLVMKCNSCGHIADKIPINCILSIEGEDFRWRL